jgi:hypothetical protein
MYPHLPAALLALVLAGCMVEGEVTTASPPARSSASLVFPHEAVRIDGVCAFPMRTHGLSVREEAPFPNGQRRFRLMNESGAAHEVRPVRVVSNVGRCDGGWASASKHFLLDQATCSDPAGATLAPGQSLELRIQPHREPTPDACTKIGLALYATVDGENACVELGSWLLSPNR